MVYFKKLLCFFAVNFLVTLSAHALVIDVHSTSEGQYKDSSTQYMAGNFDLSQYLSDYEVVSLGYSFSLLDGAAERYSNTGTTYGTQFQSSYGDGNYWVTPRTVNYTSTQENTYLYIGGAAGSLMGSGATTAGTTKWLGWSYRNIYNSYCMWKFFGVCQDVNTDYWYFDDYEAFNTTTETWNFSGTLDISAINSGLVSWNLYGDPNTPYCAFFCTGTFSDFFLSSATLTVELREIQNVSDTPVNGEQNVYDTPVNGVQNVPEPTAIALMGLGLAVLGFSRRKQSPTDQRTKPRAA